MTSNHDHGLPDGLLLTLLGMQAAVAGLIWLWGGIAGALFGAGWATLRPGETAEVLARLPARLSDPAQAWPAHQRPLLPSAPGFYGALVVLGAGGGAAILAATRVGGSAWRARGRGGARWAACSELRRLERGSGDRLTLGRRGRTLLRAERRHAVVAFGPPQSGKSAGLAIPALLEWRGPAVASSIKTDLLAATYRRRRLLGAVYVFDPFGLAGVPSHTWSPLAAARTWDGALETAWRMAAAGEVDQRNVEGGDFWSIAAEQRLAPLLYAAAAIGATIGNVVRWAYGQGGRELYEALATCASRAHGSPDSDGAHAAYDAACAFEGQAERTRASIEATVQTLLRAYRFSRVARSADGCEIRPETLLGGDTTLYLVGDAKASKLLRPLFLALLGELVDRGYERATAAGGALERPLLLCLDEAGNVAPLPNLGEIASTAPSHNIQLVSIFHDLAQARSRYGTQATTVLNSHRARMLLPGVADLETLRYFAELVGDEDAPELTRTTGAGGASRSTSRRRRPLVAPEALRQLREREALLVYGRLPPARIRLRTWFDDPRLRRLAGVS